MTTLYLILAGLAGLLNHYYVRFKQGRTNSTFKEYMLGDWGSTLSSLSANLTSSVGMSLTLPDPLQGKLLIGALYAAYAAGYAYDSMLNKDPNPAVPQSPTEITHGTINEVTQEVERKSVQDLLRDDRTL